MFLVNFEGVMYSDSSDHPTLMLNISRTDKDRGGGGPKVHPVFKNNVPEVTYLYYTKCALKVLGRMKLERKKIKANFLKRQ